jgi:hypothetical protein
MAANISKVLCAVVLLALALVYAVPALADTDYHCLNQCVNAGKTGSICMPQCTFSAASKTNSGSSSAKVPLGGHKVLTPMHQMDAQILVPKAKNLPRNNETKDFQCIAQCLRANRQYQMCNKNCTTVKTKNGNVILRKAQGFLPDNNMNTATAVANGISK